MRFFSEVAKDFVQSLLVEPEMWEVAVIQGRADIMDQDPDEFAVYVQSVNTDTMGYIFPFNAKTRTKRDYLVNIVEVMTEDWD